MKYQILHGDNRVTLKTLADNSVDAIVTDPPYGIDFLGKAWDANTGAVETYAECLRVLKPGGHILAFSAARTYHHLAVTLEAAGFEIRDQIMWIYSSGFPKSQDIGRSIQRSEKNKDPNEWSGWGTQLKPAHEPIALARKPIKLSIARNCQTHGTGALNIDASRVGNFIATQPSTGTNVIHRELEGLNEPNASEGIPNTQGRFPSNVIGDIPLYQKYFYCPKVSRSERHIGFDQLPPSEPLNSPDQVRNHPLWEPSIGTNAHRLKEKIRAHSIKTHWQMAEEMGGSLVDHEGNPTRSGNKALIPGVGDIYTHSLSKKYEDWCKQNNKSMPNSGNNHPTVKPIELMKYLIRLITPPGGTVLDPFSGSGSTGCAAVELGMTYIGCELDERYVAIARRRIDAWYQHVNPNTYNQLFVA